jgi:hypothetical protein
MFPFELKPAYREAWFDNVGFDFLYPHRFACIWNPKTLWHRLKALRLHADTKTPREMIEEHPRNFCICRTFRSGYLEHLSIAPQQASHGIL